MAFRGLRFCLAILLAIGVEGRVVDLYGQNEVIYERGATQLESTMPPSPESASRVRYADVPFNHSLGVAEYSVPVWTLEGRELSIPIYSKDNKGHNIDVNTRLMNAILSARKETINNMLYK